MAAYSASFGQKLQAQHSSLLRRHSHRIFHAKIQSQHQHSVRLRNRFVTEAIEMVCSCEEKPVKPDEEITNGTKSREGQLNEMIAKQNELLEVITDWLKQLQISEKSQPANRPYSMSSSCCVEHYRARHCIQMQQHLNGT
ncbi:uncharacterized protein BO97DRAFT_410638 [Aspergillus homomorphus CBS 101889]|uniref:Uncharacterized protein n=1 Tax=Aspergillus homomorphus (strain CBS 101889) TaxID=1450537 RepID=A0A395I7X6_ASPHC|nr:hypothetical protein BO97DRAFT_410638 [Aspergillus homomorphus CBS 101889]RAL16227.1 hypothetical protein BO97DRAFT_410638 [Aspergillus homomorphus CBS 101889]